MERVDVAVVGAGVVGLAVARELRERGHRVAVLERTGIGSGASGVQPGGVRQQWGTRVACRLARESIAFWREADERLKSRVPLTLRRSGYLFVARSRETLDRLAANVALQQEEGVPSQIVGAAEAAELVPGLAADQIAGGAWCAEDGYFDRPQAVVESFANGLEVRLETVETLRALRADAIVVAAGAETKALLATIGVEVPIEREDRYLFFSEPIRERLLEPLVVAPELAFAAKQLADGRVLASDLTARGDADAGRERWRATIRSATDTLLPQLTHVSYPLLVRGVYDVTPDHQPILGPVADAVHVAAGFSGHGFMISPAVARIVADAVEGVRDPVLDILGAERFAAGRLVPEPQLI
ncbi:MAG TPA: FAD-binding oxidoreductase [Gaiellaceae bacterium]|jgi:sarcosine oxidase, subunit beta